MRKFLQFLYQFLRTYSWTLLALLLFIAELGSLTFFRKQFGLFVSPVVAFLISVSLGLIGCRLSLMRSVPPKRMSWFNVPILVQAILFLAGLLVLIPLVRPIIQQTPIDPSFSDIIPQLWNLVDRFRAGTFPYDPITDWGFTMYPTYLPLQWGPFILPDLLQFDYRWMSLGVLLFATALLVVESNRLNLPFLIQVALLTLSFVALYYLIEFEPIIFGVTIESLLAGYYLLLGLSLFSRSMLIRATGILLCLLSRYALVLWLPLYLVIVLVESGRNKTIQLVGLLTAGVLVIYVVPFLSQDLGIFLRGYEYHTKAALAEWSGQNWQTAGAFPAQLTNGVGLAAWFFDSLPGPITTRLQVLQRLHLIGSVLVVLGATWFFWSHRARIDPMIFAAGSLKLYLAIFYHFIQIPYVYLYVVPLFFSLIILLTTAVPKGELSIIPSD